MCAHLHADRSVKRDRDFMQPSAGLQIASQIDRDAYDVSLYHEMWHGSFTGPAPAADIVFLTGLQKDFDRQRQLAYLFKRQGAVTVAGGSVCTLFPDFAKEFFDVVCAGGVDSVRDVLADFESGTLRRVYSSPQVRLTDYPVDYRLLDENGIRPSAHLVEASRGCNFKCDFCALPAEGARHTKFGVSRVMKMIDASIDASPRRSLRRAYPTVWFIDNNFANERAYARELCAQLRANKRVKAWGALVTQDVLKNHDLVSEMARSKCQLLFTGIESLDPAFLQSHRKRQNVKHASSLFEDVTFAKRAGITVIYGYLFDPRMSTTADMAAQVQTLADIDALTFPSFFSFVAPLLGTPLFWESADRGELRPNLRLRDLEGQSIAYRDCLDPDDELSRFANTLFKRTDTLVSGRRLVAKSLAAGWDARRGHPLQHVLTLYTNLRVLRNMRRRSQDVVRSYLGGTEILDPQYRSYPSDIAPEDKSRWFDPIMVTDAQSRPAEWLERYRPAVAA
ncbi:MAG TPA: hypothetical protein VF587_12335 [Solirubrobacteraceae bacterium]|jgi:radical SAM superfamily enzyme YgiQ (UPF0313 family)